MLRLLYRFLARRLFTKDQRELIIGAVCDYTDYPEDVEAEHAGEPWFEEQQDNATKIVMILNN